MSDFNLYGVVDTDEVSDGEITANDYSICVECGIVTDARLVHFCKETVSSDMEKVFRSIAAMQEKIDRVDETITKATAIMQHISDTIGPIIDKLSKNPILKNFL